MKYVACIRDILLNAADIYRKCIGSLPYRLNEILARYSKSLETSKYRLM